jgi:hypothetical protein
VWLILVEISLLLGLVFALAPPISPPLLLLSQFVSALLFVMLLLVLVWFVLEPSILLLVLTLVCTVSALLVTRGLFLELALSFFCAMPPLAATLAVNEPLLVVSELANVALCLLNLSLLVLGLLLLALGLKFILLFTLGLEFASLFALGLGFIWLKGRSFLAKSDIGGRTRTPPFDGEVGSREGLDITGETGGLNERAVGGGTILWTDADWVRGEEAGL